MMGSMANLRSPKKKRGPSATGEVVPVHVRLRPDQLAELDAWAYAQDDTPSRPEAIRRIIAKALGGQTPVENTD